MPWWHPGVRAAARRSGLSGPDRVLVEEAAHGQQGHRDPSCLCARSAAGTRWKDFLV